MRGLSPPANERPAFDWDLCQQANDYRAWMDVALQRYAEEGRSHQDPANALNLADPSLEPARRHLERHAATVQHGGVWLGGDDAMVPLLHERAEFMATVLYHYLGQAKKVGIDLYQLFNDEKPPWLSEYLQNSQAWLDQPPRDRFEKIETYRAARLYQQWKQELGAIPDHAHCLEIGCGSGLFTREVLAKHPSLNWQATDLPRPMPIDGTALDRNKASWFKQCDLGQPLPYDDASQDVLFINNVLHHVDPDFFDDFMNEAQRVLKPGGRIFVTEEYAPSFDVNHLRKILPRMSRTPNSFSQFTDQVFWPEDLGHQRSPEEWRATIEKHAFQQASTPRIVGTFGTPGLPVMEACMVFTKTAA